MKLHGYYRSSASYRVRIALNLKGLQHEQAFRHLLKKEQLHADYLALNPNGLVPTLEVEGAALTQSLAIIEYLDETVPEPPLLPVSPLERARVRALALTVACEIHPLNNLRVLRYLSRDLGLDEAPRGAWYRHWVESGFAALEQQLTTDPRTGTYCHGEQPGLADLCLVPQIYNAVRFECDLTPYPTINRISTACSGLAAFQKAAPENQPDYEQP